VSWSFRNKKEYDYDLSASEITARLRGFILDSQIHNGHEIAVILGCAVSSDEVMEKEEEESDKRVQKISYLVPLIYAHSHTLAEGAMEFQRTSLADTLSTEDARAIPNETWIESRKLMEQVSMSALLGSISQLIDMGLLEIPKQRRRK
jgi:hypothetical protein